MTDNHSQQPSDPADVVAGHLPPRVFPPWAGDPVRPRPYWTDARLHQLETRVFALENSRADAAELVRVRQERDRLDVQLDRALRQVVDLEEAGRDADRGEKANPDDVHAELACGARTVHDGEWRECARSAGHPGPHVSVPRERLEW